MVRRVGGIHVPRDGSGEMNGKVVVEEGYARCDDPPKLEELIGVFRRWVKNSPEGTFQEVLRGWVDGRTEMKLSVNPGPFDPNEKVRKKPTKAFQTLLEGVFNEVRAQQAKPRKRKR